MRRSSSHRLDGPPQTNEPQRSSALAPGYLTVAAETGLSLCCSEIGASAGLNLVWDRFAYAFGPAAWGDPASPVRLAPDWRGPIPPLPAAVVAERAGCDRAPLDAFDPVAERRLLSYVWADQAERFARTRAALALVRAAGVSVARADAADWLEPRLADPRPGQAHVVAHSIMWSYMPACDPVPHRRSDRRGRGAGDARRRRSPGCASSPTAPRPAPRSPSPFGRAGSRVCSPAPISTVGGWTGGAEAGRRSAAV